MTWSMPTTALAPTVTPSFPGFLGSLPEQFGRYRIIKRLGSGGMGSVYLAKDTQLDRQVALKVPHFTEEDGPEILARIDVLVVPSVWYETFCITIREGFLAGAAVVASRLGAMAEAIEDGSKSGAVSAPKSSRSPEPALRRTSRPSARARSVKNSFPIPWGLPTGPSSQGDNSQSSSVPAETASSQRE